MNKVLFISNYDKNCFDEAYELINLKDSQISSPRVPSQKISSPRVPSQKSSGNMSHVSSITGIFYDEDDSDDMNSVSYNDEDDNDDDSYNNNDYDDNDDDTDFSNGNTYYGPEYTYYNHKIRYSNTNNNQPKTQISESLPPEAKCYLKRIPTEYPTFIKQRDTDSNLNFVIFKLNDKYQFRTNIISSNNINKVLETKQDADRHFITYKNVYYNTLNFIWKNKNFAADNEYYKIDPQTYQKLGDILTKSTIKFENLPNKDYTSNITGGGGELYQYKYNQIINNDTIRDFNSTSTIKLNCLREMPVNYYYSLQDISRMLSRINIGDEKLLLFHCNEEKSKDEIIELEKKVKKIYADKLIINKNDMIKSKIDKNDMIKSDMFKTNFANRHNNLERCVF